MAAAIKMDELLVSWLGSDQVYENVLGWIENLRISDNHTNNGTNDKHNDNATVNHNIDDLKSRLLSEEDTASLTTTTDDDSSAQQTPPPHQHVPPFYPKGQQQSARRRTSVLPPHDTWEPQHEQQPQQQEQQEQHQQPVSSTAADDESHDINNARCARDAAVAIYEELGDVSTSSLTMDAFVRITKEVCRFPSYFNVPLYQRILSLYNKAHPSVAMETIATGETTTSTETTTTLTSPQQQALPKANNNVVTLEMLEWYWKTEMEPFDAHDRFFRLVKQPEADHIVRDDFLPFIKALLADHPGLEFLSSHAEFQEKYAVTVITRIFYCVNRCHSGRITARQVRRSDLLQAFQQVDEEEDINKATRYFSYEHFYVLYCRFWELDHDRDYRITREDLLKYGDHSLSHMIVDRIFDAAPRPFEQQPTATTREYLSYEDFIYFMLSEEDKSNEVSVRYWFTCVDVDGDGCLNNMEMRSFYAVQLNRMQCMGHEVVPFEDMLCQMMDMIKPNSPDKLVTEDFLQPECQQVSGTLFDALFNLNKYLMFEQRDPFVERQRREDEFECDWDRFACIDYNRLAMEEEARDEEAMEIDWVTVDDEEEETDDTAGIGAGGQQQQQQQQQRGRQSHQQQQQRQAQRSSLSSQSGGDADGSSFSEAPF